MCICVSSELRQVFMSLRERCQQRHSDADIDICRQLISSCIFLRFLCPAILCPSLFGLSQVLPQQRVSRNLTLVAKTIQGLANFTRYQHDEFFWVGAYQAYTSLVLYLHSKQDHYVDSVHYIGGRSKANMS